MDRRYLLNRLAYLMKTGIYEEKDGRVCHYREQDEYSPVMSSLPLREKLKQGADLQELPFIFKDSLQVFFSCVRHEGIYYMIGPMSIESLSRMDLHQFYQAYEVEPSHEKVIKKYPLAEILDGIEMLANIITGREYSDQELLYGNGIVIDLEQEEKQEQILYTLNDSEEELYHHTYQEEKRLLNCVRDGQIKEAVTYTRNLDLDLGKLGKKEMNHWRNVVIVGITLCTRAAIEGGVSPGEAYKYSDFYIQKADECKDIPQLLECRNRAVEELTKAVKKKSEKVSSSNYVEICKAYINKHYREKIYSETIAEVLGISVGYLSRSFHKETGKRLQDYINEVRVENSANLLIYSEESLARIAEYVHFPSQSYFGKIFKQYKGVTPKKYREMNKPIEFFSAKNRINDKSLDIKSTKKAE